MNNIPRTLAEKVRPRHTALMIVDMQNDFCAQGGYLQRTRAESGRNPIRVDENAAIADRIGVLADAARRSGATVAWLRSIYDFKYLADAHIAMRDGEGCCLEGTWGADFFRIQPRDGDVVVDKHTFSGVQRFSRDGAARAVAGKGHRDARDDGGRHQCLRRFDPQAWVLSGLSHRGGRGWRGQR